MENDAESWAPIQDWLLRLRFANITVVLVHHEGRSGHARGTSKREDVLDTIIRLKDCDNLRQSKSETVFEMSFPKSREFYGDDKEARILRLSTETGKAVWSYETMRESNKQRVAALKNQGMQQKEIAKEIGITELAVSKIVNRMKQT